MAINQDAIHKEIAEYSDNLQQAYAERDEFAKLSEEAYLMTETAEDAQLKAISPSVALTKSPEERIKVQAVVRLLTTGDPQISMPRDVNLGSDEEVADMVEQGAEALLAASDRVSRRPLKNDAVLNAVLYDLLSIRVVCTQDLLDQMVEDAADRKKGKQQPIPEARIARVKKLVNTSPYLFEVLNSRQCYPTFDRYGLQSQLHVSVVKQQDIINSYGARGREVIQASGKDLYADARKDYVLYSYMDDLYRCDWIDDGWLIVDEHGLPFIPIVTTSIEGSGIFSSYADQCQPFLYTILKSGLHHRKTEAMTAMYTNNLVFGMTPSIKYTASVDNEEAPTPVMVAKLFQLWSLRHGAELEPVLNKGLADPAVYNGLQLAQELTEAATIYNSVIGESQSETYSQTALLSQLGRIPLETTRRMVGRCIADALELALQWVKHNGKQVKAYNFGKGALSELIPGDIPDYFNLEVDLVPALPQDKMVMAQIASELMKSGIVDIDWIREEIMNIQQPAQMGNKILKDQVKQALSAMVIQQKIQQMQPPPPPQAPPQMPEQAGGLGGMPNDGGMGMPPPPVQEQQMQPPEMGMEMP